MFLIESSSFCNIRCVFCGRENYPQDAPHQLNKHMTLEQFVHVLDEVTRFSTQHEPISCVDLHGMGEPLLWPHIRQGIQACRQRGLDIQLITNGSLLEESIIDFLLAHINFKLKVSINAATPTTLANVAKIPHPERTIQNCMTLAVKAKAAVVRPSEIMFGFVKCNENKHEAEMFHTMWKRFAPVIKTFVADQLLPNTTHISQDTRGTCPRLSPKNYFVLNNGNVTPCCSTTRILLGNIFNSSLSEIYHGDVYQHMLALNRANRLGEMEVCNMTCLAGKREFNEHIAAQRCC
ncbi:radical SAM protein [Megalodesulfovibrio paquesii]